MTHTPAERVAALTERSEILSHLEEILAADEQILASGPQDQDRSSGMRNVERTRLLSRFEQLGTILSTEGSGREVSCGVTPEETRLRRSTQERARCLAERTAALLSAWRIHKGEISDALGEIREGRRILASYLASGATPAGLDISG